MFRKIWDLAEPNWSKTFCCTDREKVNNANASKNGGPPPPEVAPVRPGASASAADTGSGKGPSSRENSKASGAKEDQRPGAPANRGTGDDPFLSNKTGHGSEGSSRDQPHQLDVHTPQGQGGVLNMKPLGGYYETRVYGEDEDGEDDQGKEEPSSDSSNDKKMQPLKDHLAKALKEDSRKLKDKRSEQKTDQMAGDLKKLIADRERDLKHFNPQSERSDKPRDSQTAFMDAKNSQKGVGGRAAGAQLNRGASAAGSQLTRGMSSIGGRKSAPEDASPSRGSTGEHRQQKGLLATKMDEIRSKRASATGSTDMATGTSTEVAASHSVGQVDSTALSVAEDPAGDAQEVDSEDDAQLEKRYMKLEITETCNTIRQFLNDEGQIMPEPNDKERRKAREKRSDGKPHKAGRAEAARLAEVVQFQETMRERIKLIGGDVPKKADAPTSDHTEAVKAAIGAYHIQCEAIGRYYPFEARKKGEEESDVLEANDRRRLQRHANDLLVEEPDRFWTIEGADK